MALISSHYQRRVAGSREQDGTKEPLSRRGTFLASGARDQSGLRGRVAGFEAGRNRKSGYFVSARDLKRASQAEKSEGERKALRG